MIKWDLRHPAAIISVPVSLTFRFAHESLLHPRNAAERVGIDTMGRDGKGAKRITTTLSESQFDEVNRIADANGVKAAFVVRRAIDQFLESEKAGQPVLPFQSKVAK